MPAAARKAIEAGVTRSGGRLPTVMKRSGAVVTTAGKLPEKTLVPSSEPRPEKREQATGS